ncbi:MAG: glycosyltransferase [Saprospiraceae bacterium]|nr:glycosyltransferase [Saprospiraceae bacterium]
MILILILCLVIHSAYYVFLFSRLVRYTETAVAQKQDGLSIVVCYKDEEKNISESLPSLLEQEFSELILVDDNSSDGTLEVLKQYESDKIKVISIKKETAGKKNAQSIGISEASYQRILLTDADCQMVSKTWSSYMTEKGSSFVLGYGPMVKSKGIVSVFSRYETYVSAIQYLSYALVGLPYMGVGRNLLIDKTLVTKQASVIKGKHLASGDDDLMINALANKTNTRICIHPDSFVYSKPKKTLRAFLKQKTRHISTSIYYKPLHQLLLGAFSSSQILFYLTVFYCFMFSSVNAAYLLGIVAIKWAIQMSINYSLMKKLKEQDLFWKIPVLDVLFCTYLVIMPIYYFFNKNSSHWN